MPAGATAPAANLFDIDDSGTAFVKVDEIQESDSQLARKAMFLCPEGAIFLLDD